MSRLSLALFVLVALAVPSVAAPRGEVTPMLAPSMLAQVQPDELRSDENDGPDPDDRFLPPDIREDIERKPTQAEQNADMDDGADDEGTAESTRTIPEEEAAPAPEPKPEAKPSKKKKQPSKRPDDPPGSRRARAADADDASPTLTDAERRRAERDARREAAAVERLNREADRLAELQAKKRAKAQALQAAAEARARKRKGGDALPAATEATTVTPEAAAVAPASIPGDPGAAAPYPPAEQPPSPAELAALAGPPSPAGAAPGAAPATTPAALATTRVTTRPPTLNAAPKAPHKNSGLRTADSGLSKGPNTAQHPTVVKLRRRRDEFRGVASVAPVAAASPAAGSPAALALASAAGGKPVPAPSPAPGKKSKKRKRDQDKLAGAVAAVSASGGSPAPGAPLGPPPFASDASPATAPGSGPAGSPKGSKDARASAKESSGGKSRKRKGEFSRTGEEAPIAMKAADRDSVKPSPQGPAYLAPLKEVLVGLVDKPRNPMEGDLALSFLGYVGDSSRFKKLTDRIDDAKTDDASKLPLLAALVEGYGDKSRVAILHRIADDPKAVAFQKLWAMEILGQLGDKTRVPVLYRLIDDKASDATDRLRALAVLAQLGDDARKDVARKLSRDEDLFLATRMQAAATLARMEGPVTLDPVQVAGPVPPKARKGGSAEGVAELKRAMNRSHLSVEERLSIAVDLAQLGELSTREFFERVVEQEADTIYDQLRALHGLALMGHSEYLGLLQETFNTKKRPRNTAMRLLVMMGDRSRIGDLLTDAKSGDTEAIRTLVLAHVMDSQKITASSLMKQARYKNLIAP